MTDEKIIKALSCCTNKQVLMCKKCPYHYENDWVNCGGRQMMEDALDLINRQKAEIEMLGLSLESMLFEVKNAHELRDEAITNAIKDFAERVKTLNSQNLIMWNEQIDNLVKEMIGEQE